MCLKEVMFGIVYNPILDQLWTAKKGFGAEHNGKKVRVTHLTLKTCSSDQCIQLHIPGLRSVCPGATFQHRREVRDAYR